MKTRTYIIGTLAILGLIGCGGGGGGHHSDSGQNIQQPSTNSENLVVLTKDNAPGIVSTTLFNGLSIDDFLGSEDIELYSLNSKKYNRLSIMSIVNRYQNRNGIKTRGHKESYRENCEYGGYADITESETSISITAHQCKQDGFTLDGHIDARIDKDHGDHGYISVNNFKMSSNDIDIDYKKIDISFVCNDPWICEDIKSIDAKYTADVNVKSNDLDIIKGKYRYINNHLVVNYNDNEDSIISYSGDILTPCTENKWVSVKTLKSVVIPPSYYVEDVCPIDGKIELIGNSSKADIIIYNDSSIDIKIDDETIHYDSCNDLPKSSCVTTTDENNNSDQEENSDNEEQYVNSDMVIIDKNNAPIIVEDTIDSLALNSNINQENINLRSINDNKNIYNIFIDLYKEYNNRVRLYSNNMTADCNNGGTMDITYDENNFSISAHQCQNGDSLLNGNMDIIKVSSTELKLKMTGFDLKNSNIDSHYDNLIINIVCDDVDSCNTIYRIDSEVTAEINLKHSINDIDEGLYKYRNVKIVINGLDKQYSDISINGDISTPCLNKWINIKTVKNITVENNSNDCPIGGKIEVTGGNNTKEIITFYDDKSLDINVNNTNLHYDSCKDLPKQSCVLK